MALLARNINPLIIKLFKLFFFILISAVVGRALGDPYCWLSYEFVLEIGCLIHGAGELGAENIDDTYFYIDLVIVMGITAIIYLLTMKFIRKIRRE
ncbi:hypothetical protein J1781_20775 [Rahnella sp. C60]|uniref:hypothetical protein n=1 Tax=Rahnella perminowiae TaxID=2816244 RepID=UPI001C2654A2|nr:hypothetical protein [Rahnella perminowiae]MBU9813150.1 hypothetical protein [Rahnella perminowiae]MBU9817263.1 hypothetical protein [Rahnella perminowiae]